MMVSSISERKQNHLDICLDPSCKIESGETDLGDICLPHRCMPELDVREVELSTTFIGMNLKLPLLISCMTGGTAKGREYNFLLATIAAERGIAIGTGSIRIMLESPDTRSHFQLKKHAPDVPVLANIGAAQLLEYSPERIAEAVMHIEADGLYVHLNPAQEFFQNRGERNFSGWFDAIRRLLDHACFPILVKETGCGIHPLEGLKFLKAGVAYVDIAGNGGTDWIAVETCLKNPENRLAGTSFRGWGYSTGLLMLAYRNIARNNSEVSKLVSERIIASGGLRTPRDCAVVIACGALIAAAALPFIQKASLGADKVHSFIDSIEQGLKAALILTGAGDLKRFRNLPLRMPSDLERAAKILAEEALKLQ